MKRIGLVLALASCGGGTAEMVQAPAAARVVVIPDLGDETVEAVPSAAPAPQCPPDAFAEHGRCVRVVASPEIPSWTAPTGQLDPCGTWTSDKGIYDCDPRNESAADAGAG
ncbi:MAG TPA: hypothetical protein VF765_19820 [Polyangiaceae bacterium]